MTARVRAERDCDLVWTAEECAAPAAADGDASARRNKPSAGTRRAGGELPLPEEEIFTSPPYLFVEIMSEEDAMSGLQDRIDDYLRFGAPNIWVIAPWKHRGWRITNEGWLAATDGVMRTADGRVAMPLPDVLLP